MNKPKNTKFEVSDILPLAIVIVVASIGIAYGLSVLGDIREDMGSGDCTTAGGYWNSTSTVCQVNTTDATLRSANSAHYNASVDTIEGVAKFSDKIGLIVTVIIAAILIGLLVRYLMAR